MADRLEVSGVRVGDVYRDSERELWEVIGLVTEPQALFQRARDGKQVTHVIGCLNMEMQFPGLPLREPGDG